LPQACTSFLRHEVFMYAWIKSKNQIKPFDYFLSAKYVSAVHLLSPAVYFIIN